MTDHSKTIMCGVLFLDIVEYSRKPVSGQISLKERFNAYLSVAIRDVPIEDRIILDTGDGAALSFLGDVGDALQVALSMRESLREGLHMEPPLLVRMGINLGPVRLVRDLNGRPNIVGDGINVAQRVMGFADPGQILVSRTYYDAVSRISTDYADMFHYQGSRTDKHVREHEIYAIGYMGEFTDSVMLPGESSQTGMRAPPGVLQRLLQPWQALENAFVNATPLVRWGSVGMLLVLIVAALVARIMLAPAAPAVAQADIPPAAAAPAPAATPAGADTATPAGAVPNPAVATKKPANTARQKAEQARKDAAEKFRKEMLAKEMFAHGGPTAHGSTMPAIPADKSMVVVSCAFGAALFVDGQSKGKVGQAPTWVQVEPGKHMVQLMLKSRAFSKNVETTAGRAVWINPDICY
jgi:hypothetical protein